MRAADTIQTLVALRRVIAVAVSTNRFYAAGVLAANTLVSLLPAAIAYTSKKVIDALLPGAASPAAGGLGDAVWLALLYVGLLIGQQLGQAVLMLASETLTERGARNIHVAIIRGGMRLEGLRHLETPEFHDERLMLESNALYLPMNCLRLINDTVSVCIAIAAMSLLLSRLHVLIPVFMIACALPEVVTQIKAHQLRYEGVRETAHDERRKNYYRSVLIEPECAKEVRMYGLKEYFLRKHADASAQVLGVLEAIRQRQIKRSLYSRLLASTGTVVPYLWTVAQARHGASAGEIVMFMMAIAVIHQQLLRAAQTIAAHQDVLNVARQFAAWLEMASEIVPPGHVVPIARVRQRPPAVRIEGVWFKYPGATAFTLKGLDLEIPSGRSLAVVGRNGSGKSTLVKLLCRLYDPSTGTIYYDDIDIRQLEIEDLRRSTAVIFQDFVHYDLTVAENIALRAVSSRRHRLTVRRAARDAGATALIAALPLRYRTPMGRGFAESDGVELSGGQWQKIALARAFYRDAGMLVLDEPTASLDIATEARIYTNFRKMTQGKTAVLISHRLSTVRMAERIAVIDDGRLRELGDHDSLMRLRGTYWEMFTAQAERYRRGASLSA